MEFDEIFTEAKVLKEIGANFPAVIIKGFCARAIIITNCDISLGFKLNH